MGISRTKVFESSHRYSVVAGSEQSEEIGRTWQWRYGGKAERGSRCTSRAVRARNGTSSGMSKSYERHERSVLMALFRGRPWLGACRDLRGACRYLRGPLEVERRRDDELEMGGMQDKAG